jgi:SAM-dependent methyltransferase
MTMTDLPPTITTNEPDPVERLAGRTFTAGVGALELCNIYLGVHLGLYRELSEKSATPAELAARTGCAERYLSEWLQAQAISGFATVDGDDPAAARYGLAEGMSDVFVEPTSPGYLGGLADTMAAAASALPMLVNAFRTGAGVPYAAYGPDAVSGQEALNRPAFVNSLVAEWLPQLPDVLERLRDTAHPARVGDFACGTGWASIELARAFPHLVIEGLDSDEESITRARRYAAEHNVADRVSFEVVDLSDDSADWTARFDVVLFAECVHDFPRPVEALAHARQALKPGGTVLVVDERAAETFAAPGDDVQRFLASASVVWCLPQGLVGPNPEPVGTLIRPAIMHTLAERAGYAGVTDLPIEHPFWRFYRLSA